MRMLVLRILEYVPIIGKHMAAKTAQSLEGYTLTPWVQKRVTFLNPVLSEDINKPGVWCFP